MPNIERWVMVLGVLLFTGCATGRGALIGGVTGAALGAGTGVFISSEDLVGSSSSAAAGNLSLDKGTTALAGTVVGAVFGAIVGAMIGRDYDEHDAAEEALPAPPESPSAHHADQPVAF